MSITGTLKKNGKNDNYNLKTHKYVGKKEGEGIADKKEELKKKLIEEVGSPKKVVTKFYVNKQGNEMAEITIFINENEVSERVKKQVETLGEKGLTVKFENEGGSINIDNVTSPLIEQGNVGSILKGAIRPQKLEEGSQEIKLRGNLIETKKEIDGKEVKKKMLAISIPVMGKNGRYSDETINKLAKISEDLGIKPASFKKEDSDERINYRTHEGKSSMVIYVPLANTGVVKEFEETLTEEDKKYVEMTFDVSSLVVGSVKYPKSIEKVEIKSKEQKTEEKAEEQKEEKKEEQKEEKAEEKKSKRPTINF
jgi:hypothetical protein